jgi:hypothetical protein
MVFRKIKLSKKDSKKALKQQWFEWAQNDRAFTDAFIETLHSTWLRH